MTTHEVLVAARNIQERRDYVWTNGQVELEGACCPGCSIAAVVGEHNHFSVAKHPAAVALAEQFTCCCGHPDPDVSHKVGCEETTRGHAFTLGEVLAAFDKAIAATAPEPADPFPSGVPVVGAVA